jgi:hypothetical protein
MRNLVIAIAILFTANVFATPFFIKDISNKTVVLNLSSWKQSSITVTIKNDDGNIVFSEKIEKPNSSRQYNLSKVGNGDYIISIENKQKIAIQSLSIKGDKVEFSKKIEETFKPIFTFKENVWAIQALTLGKNAEVTIFDENNNVVFFEKIEKPVLEKQYNVSKLPAGNYDIQYSINEQYFTHSTFKK